MQLLKNIFGPLWLVFVFGWYIKFHDYYEHSLDFWKWMLIVIGVWGLVLGIIAWIIRKKKTLTLNPIKAIALSFLLIWITGVTIYTTINVSVFGPPYQIIFMDDQNMALVEEGQELLEGVSATIVRGSIMMQWDETQKIFPEEIQELFVEKSILNFGIGLGKTLLITLGWWVFLTFLFYNLGAWVVREKKWSAMSFFKSIGVGMGITMGCLFLLGVAGIMTKSAVQGLIIVLLIIGFTNAKSLIKGLWESNVHLGFSKKNVWVIPVLIVLGILISLNIIDGNLAIPIGFDSLVLYHNTPNLLLQYGHLISGVPAYNFELLISLALILFKSVTLGLQTSQFGNLLALALLFKTLKLRFSWEESLALLTLFVSLPMTNFLMHIDLKIDLLLLFFTLLALHSVMETWHARENIKEEKKHIVWIGLWLGLAFGIKYTTVNAILTLFVFWAFGLWGWIGVGAVGLLGFSGLGFMEYLLPLKSLSEGIRQGIWMGMGVIGVGMSGWIFFKKQFKFIQVKKFFIVIGMVGLLMAPWFIFNGIQAKSWSPKKWLNGSTEKVTISKTEFGVDQNQCVKASNYDELVLYTGSGRENSLKMTANILWESTINSKLKNNRITDMGFLFLGFALFVMLAWPEIKKDDPSLRMIGGVTLFYGFLWLVTSNGIIWYGMPLFLGILLIYGKAWKTEKWTYGVLGFWLVMALFLRYSDTINQNTGFLYAGGVTDKSIFMEQTVPGTEAIKAIINTEDAKKKNVYLAGRFINYSIEENDHRLYMDQLLDAFMCFFMNDDPQITLDRLREKNFGYMIVMQDGLGIEADQNGPLHQQFQKFQNFADHYLVREVYRSGISLYSIPE